MFSLFSNGVTISLVIFLIILAIYLWYGFSIIYHLIRFGVGVKPKILALVFFLGSFVLFTILLALYRQIDWPEIFQNIF